MPFLAKNVLRLVACGVALWLTTLIVPGAGGPRLGRAAAGEMRELGLCLEEYLQQELPEGYTGASDPYDLPKQS